MRIRDLDLEWNKFGSGNPGTRIEKSLIRDLGKHPGSATLVSETFYLLATLALLHMQVELIPWKFLHYLKV
jgi:hypothetical protein